MVTKSFILTICIAILSVPTGCGPSTGTGLESASSPDDTKVCQRELIEGARVNYNPLGTTLSEQELIEQLATQVSIEQILEVAKRNGLCVVDEVDTAGDIDTCPKDKPYLFIQKVETPVETLAVRDNPFSYAQTQPPQAFVWTFIPKLQEQMRGSLYDVFINALKTLGSYAGSIIAKVATTALLAVPFGALMATSLPFGPLAVGLEFKVARGIVGVSGKVGEVAGAGAGYVLGKVISTAGGVAKFAWTSFMGETSYLIGQLN